MRKSEGGYTSDQYNDIAMIGSNPFTGKTCFFQNALYQHPAFPAALHREIEAWCFSNAADERKAGQTDQQFVYTTRKKAIGPFKRQLWDLEMKDEILAAQRRKIGYLFTELGVNDSRAMVERYVHPVEVHRPMPDGLVSVAND